MQHGMNVGDLVLSDLFDAIGDNRPINPEPIQAKGRAVGVKEQPTEADCTPVMEQVEKNIDLVYRLQGLDTMAEASRRQQLQQALDPVNAVTGIAKSTVGQAGALDQASTVAGM